MIPSNHSNFSHLLTPIRCRPFDPYWIYALTVPFLGVIFNGVLLAICLSFRRSNRSGSSINLRTLQRTTSISTTSTPAMHNVHLADLSPLNSVNFDSFPSRPEVSLNWFVANCAFATLVGSCLRTVSTAYLFTNDYALCPNTDYDGMQVIEILVYIQYSVFSVAYLNFLIVLNLDKLLFVLKPLHYRELMTRGRVMLVCAITWLLSLAWFPLYFAQADEDVVKWATILVTVLMVGPSVFCLISSTILAVVVFRLRTHDRKVSISYDQTFNLGRSVICCAYLKSGIRLFQAVLWTCVTSLPHPISIIISYYTSAGDPSTDMVVKIFIGYLSIAYFSGTPLMIFLIYPIYWRKFKFQFLRV